MANDRQCPGAVLFGLHSAAICTESVIASSECL